MAPMVDHYISTLVGAASHLVLDRFEDRFPQLEYLMHALGAVGLLVVAVHVGRRRLLSRWYGDPPPRRRPGLFWSVAGIVTLPAAAVTPFLPVAFLAHTTGIRLLCAIGARLLAASAVTAAGTGCESSRP
jgi:hypothetical protein